MSRRSDFRSTLRHNRISSGAASLTALALFASGLAHQLRAQAQRNPLLIDLPPDRPQAQSATSVSREVKDIFARAAHAVVKIHGVDEHSDIYGTGFFVDPTGTLYTSYSVGGEAGNFWVEFEGKQYPAHAVLSDIRSGIAMLKVDMATPALPIGKADDLEVATPVITIGYPLDLPKTPSFGMIA